MIPGRSNALGEDGKNDVRAEKGHFRPDDDDGDRPESHGEKTKRPRTNETQHVPF